MNSITGDNSAWADFFPEKLIPQIIELIVRSWEQFKKPQLTDYEEPITRRFREFLRKNKNSKKLPLTIWPESSETDPISGKEIGRIDLRFISGHREEVYFAFECKRLRYPNTSGNIIPNTGEYVGKDGMMCFVTGKYSKRLTSGGMIGYVLDGELLKAQQAVKKFIEKKASKLCLIAGTTLMPYPKAPNVASETKHNISNRNFTLYHLFLSNS